MTNEVLEELNLDDIFTNPDNPDPNATPQVAAVTPPEPAPPPQPAEPFLKTRTGTVYKSAEDAAQGVAVKDELIAKLRQEAIDRTGIDPVTGQPVRKPEPQSSYQQDPKKFVEDLASAAKSNNADAYHGVYQKLVNEAIAPYAPAIAAFAKSQAVESVASKAPGFREFYNSNDYAETLERHTLLKDAISQGESNPQAQAQLTQLYQMAFDLGQARKMPEVVRAQAQPTPRPTVSSTSLPSFPTQSASNATPGMGSSEERKALIEQQERAGVLTMRL